MLVLDTSAVMPARSAQTRPWLRDLVCARGARSCELELWSPWRLASSSEVLSELRSFRRSVHEEFGSMRARDADAQAWHLLARRRETSELVGCIRFIVFERARMAEVVESVLQSSGCRFSPEDYARCRMALCEYWAGWLRQSGPFLQIGGLAVAESARHSALAPLLCLGANAFMRARHSRFGVVFGSGRTAGTVLYEMAGFAPMALGAGLLPPPTDLVHGERAIVMRCNPYGVQTELAPEVEQLHADFLAAAALELGAH